MEVLVALLVGVMTHLSLVMVVVALEVLAMIQAKPEEQVLTLVEAVEVVAPLQ